MHQSKNDRPHEDRLLDLSSLTKVGRYEIIRTIGQGSAGLVFLGKDPYIQRLVALKVTPLSASGISDNFFKEIQLAGKLTHPNIVSIYDAGISRDYCHIAMEYIEGPRLSDICFDKGPAKIQEAVESVRKVILALGYAHEKGIIHRDLKPSNIMLEQGSTPKVTDFGIAMVSDDASAEEGRGTPSYMSPEQMKDEKICKQTDIFALGCILYEVLTGKKAFDGDSHFSIMYKVINDEPEPVRNINPQVPAVFDRILSKALAKNRKDRYKTCEEFAFELGVAMRGLSKAAVRPEKVNDVIDYVSGVSFFSEFSRNHVRELLASSEIIQIQEEKCIVQEGEIDDSFYIVLSGQATVMKSNSKAAEIKIGDCFGEMAYIGGQPRNATVIAGPGCILMKISGRLLDRAPATIQLLFFKKFALTLVNRLSRSNRSLNQSVI